MKTLIASTSILGLGLGLIALFYLFGGSSSAILPIGHLLAILGAMSMVVALIREGMNVTIQNAKN